MSVLTAASSSDMRPHPCHLVLGEREYGLVEVCLRLTVYRDGVGGRVSPVAAHPAAAGSDRGSALQRAHDGLGRGAVTADGNAARREGIVIVVRVAALHHKVVDGEHHGQCDHGHADQTNVLGSSGAQRFILIEMMLQSVIMLILQKTCHLNTFKFSKFSMLKNALTTSPALLLPLPPESVASLRTRPCARCPWGTLLPRACIGTWPCPGSAR
jgi:hypothetical protein